MHPSATDALVIGTLLDFPKQLFGFPYACYATDGRESLSLCLYAYRLRTGKRRVVGDANDATLKGVAARLGMTVCSDMAGAACVVVTLASIKTTTCAEAALRGVPVHVSSGVLPSLRRLRDGVHPDAPHATDATPATPRRSAARTLN